MTIIQPDKNVKFSRYVLLLFLMVFLGGGFYIFEYNSFVDSKYELKSVKQNIIDLQEANADLKEGINRLTDSKELERIAKENNLTIERKPEYLTLN